MTRPGDEAGKAMGKMEDTIDGLKEDVAIAKTPPVNKFKPLWLLTAVMVVLLIGGAVFLAVTGLTGNTRSIIENCEQRNRQLLAVNEKFQQLNTLIEVLTEATPGGPLNQPEARKAFEVLRQPIHTVTCK